MFSYIFCFCLFVCAFLLFFFLREEQVKALRPMQNGTAVKLEPNGHAARGLFFGHPLLDMLTSSSVEMLASYGICEGSVALALPEQMPIFTTLLASKNTVYHAGGSAMNTARTMKWICPEMNVCFVGAIGCDRFCEILTRALDAAGVEHLFEYHDNIPTGACASLVVHKERSMLASLGAATQLSFEHMKSFEVERAIKNAGFYYTEGFFLNTISSPDNIMLVAEHAQREGKLFCLNLNAPYISTAFGDKLRLLLPYADILFGCKEDFFAFSDMMWGDEVLGDIKEILMRLVQLPKKSLSHPRLVVCTCGEEETLVGCKGGVLVYSVPALDKTRIVDVTGAGDAFAGGFLAQYLSHSNLDYCVEAGHASAAIVIRQWGANFCESPPQLKKHITEYEECEA
ncbi:adenosine kinase, putative [Trypanosoma cruzi marinkellei]|uniref:Adenosine kinase n=1 Tax=Trypanosoma cruzi marinkellei TaxID=85056 RepID=K2MEF8_TRYCR|nr:adenosine kinase, putative [Trypanosoma cruzi marinkellei]